MERLALLVLFACAGAVMAAGAAAGDSEVPIHYTAQQPVALQHEEARFAEADSDVEGDEVVAHEVDHVEKTPHVPSARDAWVSEGVIPPIAVPWKAPDAFAQDYAAKDAALSAAEDAELARPDTVMQESTNTMTQSAKCLMYCANGYGLCTRSNPGGCACAAGCMCNRGESEATCSEHCHPDNQMNFVYGYHDANHFSPHFWGKSIGDVMGDYGQVRACLAGCAKRGKCAPRFCPRHPTGGYKCTECQRLEVIPRPRRRGQKTQRYYTAPRPSRDGHLHHIVKVQHSHNDVDEWGHLVRHSHTHTRHHIHYPALVESEADADAESEAETESESESEADAEGEMAVTMESNAEADQMVEAEAVAETDAAVEAAAQAEADAGYVRVTESPYATVVTSNPSNIRQYQPRIVPEKFIEPFPGEDHADNGIVSAHVPQDPLAAKIDCNFYDCTGVQSEPYVAVGSMNPVIPYRYKPDTRTTTFSTVPDMLEPRAEVKYTVVA